MVDFAGWDMPLQFSGVIAEHQAVRSRVGLFDVSHLGKLTVQGPAAAQLLDQVVTQSVATLPEWRARYGLVLTPAGGVIDDLFVYRRPDGYVVVPNAANTLAVLAALEQAAAALGLSPAQVRVADARFRWAILALQGPAARPLAERLLAGAVDLPLYGFGDFSLAGVEVQAARTGYTGEYGFELFVPWDETPGVWDALLAAGQEWGIKPIGLGARDTLRLEMGYPLHGHEISEDINPVEAGLSWAVDWAKPDFQGKAALEAVRAAPPVRRLVGMVARGPGIPRAGQAILEPETGAPRGELTSGNFSPTLGVGIGLGYVAAGGPGGVTEPGTMLAVDVRGRRLPVAVTRPPFVARGRASAGPKPAS